MQVSGKMRPVESLGSNGPWTPTVIEYQQEKKKKGKKKKAKKSFHLHRK